jgi:hypothetical protein
MDKLEYAIRQIANCDLCNGQGAQYWSNGEDYEFEDCICNPYGLILDENKEVIWDNGLSSEPELFRTMEAL